MQTVNEDIPKLDLVDIEYRKDQYIYQNYFNT